MSAPRILTAAVHQEEDWYVAQCLEVDVASQGETVDAALVNLGEAVALYLDEIDDPARPASPLPSSSTSCADRHRPIEPGAVPDGRGHRITTLR